MKAVKTASSIDTNLTRRIDPRHAEGPQIAQSEGNKRFQILAANYEPLEQAVATQCGYRTAISR